MGEVTSQNIPHQPLAFVKWRYPCQEARLWEGASRSQGEGQSLPQGVQGRDPVSRALERAPGRLPGAARGSRGKVPTARTHTQPACETRDGLKGPRSSCQGCVLFMMQLPRGGACPFQKESKQTKASMLLLRGSAAGCLQAAVPTVPAALQDCADRWPTRWTRFPPSLLFPAAHTHSPTLSAASSSFSVFLIWPFRCCSPRLLLPAALTYRTSCETADDRMQ